MITLDLRDPNLIENFKAVQELRDSGFYTDEEIQKLYNQQIERDSEEGAIHND